jgi:hypothetical protein
VRIARRADAVEEILAWQSSRPALRASILRKLSTA